MWIRFLLLSCLAAAASAQDDPQSLLLRVRGNLGETIGRLPKYMCTLTIDRSQYQTDGIKGSPSCDALISEKNKRHLKPHLYENDRLRLDVAISDSSNEIYSWVGEDRFNDRDLFQLVRVGALQTGSYSIFLSSIFTGTAASFSYNGDVVRDGRQMVEFGFEVPREKSNYLFGNRQEHVISAYGGTFLVDPKTGDLARLVVRTSQLPAEMGSCEATTTLDYNRVRLNDLDFLLPREAQLEIVETNGAELHNRTVYSACHRFLGESTLTFDEPITVADKSATPAFALPAGLPFTVVFTQPINPATSSAGDRVKGKLTRAIRDASSKLLVPEGAEVMARIVKLEHFQGPPSSFTIGVKLETVNVGGTHYPLSALSAVVSGSGRRFEQQPGLGRRIPLGSFDTLEDRSIEIFEFRDTGRNRVIESGLATTWTTQTPPCAKNAFETACATIP
jgi:hypothetical protein